MTKIKLIDSTLRDGSHALHHQYTPEMIQKVAKSLEDGGVYAAEVGHGAGVGGSVIQFGLGKHSDIEILSAAKEVLNKTKLATLLVPGLGTKEDLKVAHSCGVNMVRVALHCTEVDVGQQHIGLAKELGMEAVAFFMMSHMNTPKGLAEQAKMAKEYGADIIYFADSSGAMAPSDIRERARAIKDATGLPIGVHTHNNLGSAIANSIAAIEEGVEYVDACLQGFGPGSGNCCTEALVSVLEKMKIDSGCDLFSLLDGGEFVRSYMPKPLEVDHESVVLGHTGIYSSFFLPALEAAKEYNVKPRDIFIELGKRKVVGGQEDQIIEIAYKLSRK